MAIMQKLLAYVLLFTMIALTSMLAQDKKAPTKLVFNAKNGNVTYDHTAHAKREKNECKTSHPAPWPQDAKAPLNWKTAMHKTRRRRKPPAERVTIPAERHLRARPTAQSATSRERKRRVNRPIAN